MAKSKNRFQRSGYLADFDLARAGETITVAGWVDRQRDLGNLVFIDLRDRTGILQLTFDDETSLEVMETAKDCHSEYVLLATGLLRERENKNPDLSTGAVELYVSSLRVLSKAQVPPFEVNAQTNVNLDLRLRYRYLDLRRAPLQEKLRLRHEIARVTREYFYENDFLEIETPTMMKSTPEGARDYLVPSRVHPGKFYALPQSPQIYKQLLMLSGVDRYIQLARCFRDEDLRADRQPEFTQIDLEMSFVDVEDILELVEGYVQTLFEKVMKKPVSLPIPRMTYQQAMERYGSDKPDVRFGMELQDISALAREIAFPVFKSALREGGSVRGIVVDGAAGALSRKKIDKLTEFVRGIGAGGLAYIRWDQEEPTCSFQKFLKEGQLSQLCTAFGCKKGDVCLIVSDQDRVTLPVLGALRLHVARTLGKIPDGFAFLWITEFPFFEQDEDGEWVAMHHPFTMPMEESIPYLFTDPGNVKAKAYDLVLNGTELASGSMRITDPALQQKMFEALGLSPQEIAEKFGFLVEAYRYGAPPHGGIGIGLDRLTMVLGGAESLRDVIAFPKVQNASELMSGCPSEVDSAQLSELHIRTVAAKEMSAE